MFIEKTVTPLLFMHWLRPFVSFGLKAHLVLLWFCLETNNQPVGGFALTMFVLFPIGFVYLGL